MPFRYRKRLNATLERFNARGPYPLGVALTGLTSGNGTATSCLINDDNILFFPGTVFGGFAGKPDRPLEPRGSVPLRAISGIELQDNSTVSHHTQQVMSKAKTRQRGSSYFLFPFVSFNRSRGRINPKYKTVNNTNVDTRLVLTIRWTEPAGYATSASFAFDNGKQANEALSTLRSAVGPITPTEKKCPYCAEMVKAEAVKCKHCGADLTPAIQGDGGA